MGGFSDLRRNVSKVSMAARLSGTSDLKFCYDWEAVDITYNHYHRHHHHQIILDTGDVGFSPAAPPWIPPAAQWTLYLYTHLPFPHFAPSSEILFATKFRKFNGNQRKIAAKAPSFETEIGWAVFGRLLRVTIKRKEKNMRKSFAFEFSCISC